MSPKNITVNGVKYVRVEATPEVEVKPHYFTKAEMEAGLGHPCVLGCAKKTRSLERSLRHATNNAELKLFGHNEL